MTRISMVLVTVALLLPALLMLNAAGDVGVPGLFSDHMVLQRGMKVPVWGTAAPGEQVTVTLEGYRDTPGATADANGDWKVYLGPLKAGGPYTLAIAGAKNTLLMKDVLVGEVWFSCGQSNMQWPVKSSMNGEAEMRAADLPRVRLFNVPLIVTQEPQKTCGGQWVVCSPETAAPFAAVAFFFGRDLQKDLDVPIGLIDSSSGGRPIESYMSRDTLKADPRFSPILAFWEEVCARGPQYKAEYDKAMEEWKKAAAEAQAAGKPEPQQPYPPLGRGHWNEPGGLFNGAVHPVAPYGIRGALWYQGESNTDRADQYKGLFSAMLHEWRSLWAQGDFPFLYVQLANYGKPQTAPEPDSRWAEFRETQRLALAEKNTGMAVAIDIGEAYDIHAKDKQDVGARLERAALAKAYGKRLTWSGPLYKSTKVKNGEVYLRFDQVGKGLCVGTPDALKKDLEGFIVAGPDRKFVWAKARIVGKDKVALSADGMENPIAVRYAWAENPICNLYNSEGLPASPFRTDDWPLESVGRTVTTMEYLGAVPPKKSETTPK